MSAPSEPQDQKPKDAPNSAWEKSKHYLPYVGAVVGLFAAGNVVYGWARDAERASGDSRVLDEKRKSQAAEADLRECRDRLSELKAVLSLKDADRERLLAAAAISPPLHLTLNGAAFKGPLVVGRAYLPECLDIPVWFSNTGLQDVHLEGLELISSVDWYGERSSSDSFASVSTEPNEGPEPRNRHWVELTGTVLSPGSKRLIRFMLCSKPGAAPRLEATVGVYSHGFLPLRSAVEFSTAK